MATYLLTKFFNVRIIDSLKTNFNDFVFIFARTHQEATQYFAKMFLQTPKDCYKYPLDFEFVRGNEIVTFREMKKEHTSFPAVAGYYKKM
ncbi:hypothetical protein ACLM5H_07670 [Fredinandcohnia humi]